MKGIVFTEFLEMVEDKFSPELVDGAIISSFFRRITLNGRSGKATVTVDAINASGNAYLSAMTTAELVENGTVAARVELKVPVVQPPETEAEEPFVVAGVQVSERSRVAGLAPLDERAVPLQIDVVTKASELFLAKRHLSRPLKRPPSRRSVTLWLLIPGSEMPATKES